ncbi:hypothetical protein [Streptomyces sp. NPDC059224]|uniref:hypothetical protein n=1 Tax=Streptomyces sp. NPDC059224 TaxID=3346775 RepID=UPI003696EC99
MRGKQYLMVLHTLHWADEVRDPGQELEALPRRGSAQGNELETARQLIDALTTDWNPKGYRDTYEERVKELVDAKAQGEETVTEQAATEATDVIDLMEAPPAQRRAVQGPQGPLRRRSPRPAARGRRPASGKATDGRRRQARQ